jgi:hypothetical protein
MATTIVTTCPECDKEIKVPANLEGKKIRCKGCENVFVVQATAPAKTKPAKPAAKPAAKKGPAPQGAKAPTKAAPPKPEDDEDNPNPYGVTHENLTARCPHCAAELESEDAVICLICGYNTQTRARHEITKTIEHNWIDWTFWLAPGIICVLVFLGAIGGIVFLLVLSTPIIDDAIKQEAWWAFAPRMMQLWGTILGLATMFFTARFAIKRLILHPRPPEKIKKR